LIHFFEDIYKIINAQNELESEIDLEKKKEGNLKKSL